MSEIIPDVMRVVEIAAPGGPDQLRLASRPTPKPGKDEVLVKVAAAGVNRPAATTVPEISRPGMSLAPGGGG